MSTAAVLAAIPLSALLAGAWAPWLISMLRALKFGKQIRLEGPSRHLDKAGTPTMGGGLMIVTATVVTIVLHPVWSEVGPPLLALLAFGAIGAIDDLANMKSREGIGLRVRYKFVWHTLLALAPAVWLSTIAGEHVVRIPGRALDLGIWFIPLATLAIFASSAGMNEVDGLDGLAGGTAAIAFTAFLVIALLMHQAGVALVCATILGSAVAFLWFNVNPARMFMGDTGSLALGACLGTVAIATGWVLLLPIVGIVLVGDLLSVILQVGYFKATHGRRIFRMSPYHHHLELIGWPETLIVFRFWLVSAVAAAVGVAIASI